jgi:hypothetical protein
MAGSPAAASPGPGPASPSVSEAAGPTPAPAPTSSKPGKGRSKDGTARKCANCGQVGHIKTNRKSVKFSKFVCRCAVPNFGPEEVKESKPKAAVASKKKKTSGPGLLDSNGIAWTPRAAGADADADLVTAPINAAFAMGSLEL